MAYTRVRQLEMKVTNSGPPQEKTINKVKAIA